MANYYETAGLKFYLYNHNNTSFIPEFLTPLKGRSNVGTSLQCLGIGFTVSCTMGKETTILNATLKGNELVGEWTKARNGKVLMSASFSARKIADM